MLIYISSISGVRHEFEVEGSTTIDELYRMVWKKYNIGSDPIAAARNSGDGLGLIWAGKRLRTRFLNEFAIDNGISVEILQSFYGSAPNNLADYNIQKESQIYMCLFETQARKQIEKACLEECSICMENLSNIAIVGYRQCSNNHFFHCDCMKKVVSCPLCRSKIWTV